MSYTPHTWQTGETVTAEKLNALEQGVANAGGGGGGVLKATFSNNTLDVTWQNIYDAGFCILYLPDDVDENFWTILHLSGISYNEYDGNIYYLVEFSNVNLGAPMSFSSDSPTGVLVFDGY